MAIIKCKMCGGDIVLSEDRTYGTCEYCGSTMTFPKVSDEQRLNLFNRANHFRRQNEFDKAIAAYDRILDQDDTDAEAHWGAVLSRYGIEYVEDPVTHERIPTCHRVQLGSILTDADYLAALEHAPDTASRDIYEKEAHRIAEIQKGILAISSQEKPYDVFICYKESDDSGSRTVDSTLAQEIYYQLTNEGYKVFFSRITLEDKLGQQYEPYIFAALNSAKVMLVVGTKPEHFNAVWVKNEWSRYLDLMKRDRSKLLIPCYRGMDPYDLPEELSALQSQDMSRIGFMQDLIRGVKKVLNAGKEETPAVVAVPTAGPGVASLHKRAVLFLEDGDWDSANEYFDRILDIDPEYAPAYIGKVQVANRVRKEDGLARCAQPLKGNSDYQKALRFASEQQKAIYAGYNRAIEERIALERKEAAYREADALEKRAAVEADFLNAAKKYDEAGEIRDAKTRAADCRAKAAAAKQAAEKQAEEYRRQLEAEREERRRQEEEARKEAERKAEQKRIEAEKRAEQQRLERERREREQRIAEEKRRKRNRTVAMVLIILVLLGAGGFAGYKYVYQPKQQYNAAQALLDAGNYDEAAKAFTAMNGYSDSAEKVNEAHYAKAIALLNAGNYDGAVTEFAALGSYSDSAQKAGEIYYTKATALFNSGDLNSARDAFLLAGDYGDAVQQAQLIDEYRKAEDAFTKQDYLTARPLYVALGDYQSSKERLQLIDLTLFGEATSKMDAGDVAGAYELYSAIDNFEGCSAIVEQVDRDYQNAISLYNDGRFDEAASAFAELKNYSDSAERASDSLYKKAEALLADGAYDEASAQFAQLGDYSDSAERADDCLYQKAESIYASGDIDGAIAAFEAISSYKDSQARVNTIRYDKAAALWQSGDLQAAADAYKALGSYSDAPQQLVKISAEIAETALAEGNYAEALTAYQRLEQTDEIRAKEYELAQTCYDEGHFAEATSAYETLGKYELSASRLPIARYGWADQLFNEGSYAEAAEQFAILGDMTDSAERASESTYQLAKQQLENGEYDAAKATFGKIKGYSDADTLAQESDYRKADALLTEERYTDAQAIFEALDKYSDSATKAEQCVYERAEGLFAAKDYAGAQALYATIHYADSADKANLCVYNQAQAAYEAANYAEAKTLFASINYGDSADMAKQSAYAEASECYDAGNYAEAEGLFAELADFQDSADRAKDSYLQQGIVLMQSGEFAKALAYLEDVEYDNSAELAAKCHYEIGRAAIESGDMDAAMAQYSLAAELPEAQAALLAAARDYAAINEIEKAIQTLWMVRKNESAMAMLREIGDLKAQSGETDKALLAYCAAGEEEMTRHPEIISENGYDSLQVILERCSLLPGSLDFDDEQRYTFAASALATGNYDLATAAFNDLGSYGDASTQALESQYQKAKGLNATDKFDEAYAIYVGLSGYKDVDSIIENDDNIAAIATAWRAQFETGNTVTYGRYEQDNNTSNGAEAIEWIVLANDDNTATLISKYALDAKPYNTEYVNVTWETCTLRKWLNGEFLNAAFSVGEQARLETVTVKMNKNSRYSTNPGNDTQDKVYLLSIDEANTLFSGDDIGRCQATVYAKVHGAYVGDNGSSWWWLRSPGNKSNYAAGITTDGSVNYSGYSVFYGNGSVRPVVILRLSYREAGDVRNENEENEDNRDYDENPVSNREYDELLIGSKSGYVQHLQQALIDQGYLSGKADGDFGKKTEEAVKKAQKAFGMEQTGIADDAFQKRLYGE